MRDDFASEVTETLARRVGMRCSNPDCRQLTSGPRLDPAKSVNVGVAAHITAASTGGPRYDPNYTKEERQSIKNGIWLCQTCAKLVDNDPGRYTVEILWRWKRLAEESALLAIENRQPGARGALSELVDALLKSLAHQSSSKAKLAKDFFRLRESMVRCHMAFLKYDKHSSRTHGDEDQAGTREQWKSEIRLLGEEYQMAIFELADNLTELGSLLDIFAPETSRDLRGYLSTEHNVDLRVHGRILDALGYSWSPSELSPVDFETALGKLHDFIRSNFKPEDMY